MGYVCVQAMLKARRVFAGVNPMHLYATTIKNIVIQNTSYE